MKVLFVLGSFGFLRNFEPVVRLLADRGHDLYLVADRKDKVGGTRALDQLLEAYPDRIRRGYAPSRKGWIWQPLAARTRLTLDSWRYLDPRYDRSPSLRARAAAQAPALASRLTSRAPLRSQAALRLLRGLARTVERAVPPPAAVEALLRKERPDLLLLTPLLYFGSPQVDYVRAARRLGIRTVLGVGSWDHLTTKGLIHEQPDRVIVWNEAQRTEARELHGVPPDRVTVTGAQAYDAWFEQRPSLPRGGFCARVGLPDDRPFILYLCSSPFITPYEVGFVRSWVAAIRGAPDADVRRAAILIRPHPQNAAQWRDVDPRDHEAVAIWPAAGANPVDREARADYFDSMYHCAAVVGVNTSALIESGIIGRPVYTVLAEEFAGQQEGTLHFQHLKHVNGGLLTTAATLEAHVAQLAEAVKRPPGHDARSRAFIEAFVRPHGFEVRAADLFVDALEAQAASPAPAPLRRTLPRRVAALLLWPAALAAHAAAARRRRAVAGSPAVEPASGRPRRLLFVLQSPEYLRYYDSTMRLLAERGADVAVAVNALRERKQARLEGLDDPRIRVLGVVPRRGDIWTPLALAVRGTFDFVRYLHPKLAGLPALRARMKRKALPWWLHGADRVRSLEEPALRRVYAVLRRLEAAVPVSRRVRGFLEDARPDLVVVSPLVDAASDQVDMVRAAQALGIPTVAAIASWDNLTNKGHLRVDPDLVAVWNETQKAEAVRLHGVPPERVAVTGAQLFDRWFDRAPSQSREAFSRMVGLPADRAVILYTGSSVFIARSEAEVPFVRRWVAALRASLDPVLRAAAVLVRPHPFNCDAWEAADFGEYGAVSIWPRRRYTPAAEDARASLFDSLFYSAAVVGINTSAMVEAAILHRPVLSVLTPEFAATQEGTAHFHYLLPENGGFLQVADSLERHLGQLSEALRTPERTREQTERFVRTFVRPHGLGTPCTPILADRLLEAASAGARTRSVETAATRMLRIAVWPAAALLTWGAPRRGGARSVRRAVREGWSTTRKAARRTLRHGIVRPARGLARSASAGVRDLRRSLRNGRQFLR